MGTALSVLMISAGLIIFLSEMSKNKYFFKKKILPVDKFFEISAL